jgi:uncharacterized protein YjiS (DUF1127 family)
MTAPVSKNALAFKLPDMLSYHSTWDDADYIPVLPPERHGLLHRASVAVGHWVSKRTERLRVMRELQDLSDRDLADMGLTRYDIPRVFEPGFVSSFGERKACRG